MMAHRYKHQVVNIKYRLGFIDSFDRVGKLKALICTLDIGLNRMRYDLAAIII